MHSLAPARLGLWLDEENKKLAEQLDADIKAAEIPEPDPELIKTNLTAYLEQSEKKHEHDDRVKSQLVRITGIHISKNDAFLLVSRLLGALFSVVWDFVAGVLFFAVIIMVVLILLVVVIFWAVAQLKGWK